MRSPQQAVAAAVLAIALLSASAAPALRAQPQTPIAVEIVNFAYAPEELSIPVGASVIWTNRDEAPHDVVSDDRTFSSLLLATGESYQTRFDRPGRVTYYCSIHPAMSGVVNVAIPGLEARAWLPQVMLAAGAEAP